MKDISLDALIIGKSHSNEHDLLIDCYTKELGRVKAKAVSGRKLLSKLSPHLEPLSVSRLRLVEKNGLTVADALLQNSFPHLRENSASFSRGLRLLKLAQIIVPLTEPDERLWFEAVRALSANEVPFEHFLSAAGYNPLFAACSLCSSEAVSAFLPEDQSFVCLKCSSTIPENEVILL